MKKLAFITLSLATAFNGFSQTADPVVMTVGGKPVYKSEFESVYHKNNSKASNDAKSIRDYADLYSLFKMKVLEAESMGLDTLQTFKSELAGYRKQLAAPYLTD